jgi:hypothetical protein
MIAWLTGLVGSLGMGATLAGSGGLLAAFAALFAGIFMRKALWIGGISAVAIMVVWGAGYVKGGKDCNKSWELAQAEATIKDKQRQIDALNSTLQRQNEIEQRYQKEQYEDEQRIAELNRIIATTTPVQRACPRAATARELRAIKEIGATR